MRYPTGASSVEEQPWGDQEREFVPLALSQRTPSRPTQQSRRFSPTARIHDGALVSGVRRRRRLMGHLLLSVTPPAPRL
jgi:hypothetical protein